MTEASYYESDTLWRSEEYEAHAQRDRFAACTRLIPSGTESLLDVGAGQGAFLTWVARERAEISVRGIERSRAAIRASSVPLEEGRIEALPDDRRSVDVVTALEVLEHLPFGIYESGLKELARVARDAVIITVPYAERRQYVECPYCGCRFRSNYHMRTFTRGTLVQLFPGFQLDHLAVISSPDYLGAPLLRWGYRVSRGGRNEMPVGSLCPQCSYRQESPSAFRRAAQLHIKRWLPSTRRPRWWVARYRPGTG